MKGKRPVTFIKLISKQILRIGVKTERRATCVIAALTSAGIFLRNTFNGPLELHKRAFILVSQINRKGKNHQLKLIANHD